MLLDTGSVTGAHFYDLNWSPGSQTKVFVRIDPNVDSGWGFHLTCPNGSIPDNMRVVKNVSLGLTATPQTGNCYTGSIDFYVDDIKAGTVNLPGGGSVSTNSYSGEHHIWADSSKVVSGPFGCNGPITLSYSYGFGTQPLSQEVVPPLPFHEMARIPGLGSR